MAIEERVAEADDQFTMLLNFGPVSILNWIISLVSRKAQVVITSLITLLLAWLS